MRALPSELEQALSQILGQPPQSVQPLRGGDINLAARFECAGRSYVVKWNDAPPVPPPGWPGMFEAEWRGLGALSATKTVRVPECYAHADQPANGPSYILMEWLEGEVRPDLEGAGAALGRSLAAQHRATGPAFGFDQHNYCGRTPQSNRWHESWVDFFAQERLGFQARLAAARGLLPPARRKRLELLITRLERWLPAVTQPSLLHGDLWGGNWLVTKGNIPAIIDPAVYYGDREAELAMCRLFGGFPTSFFAAYEEVSPLAADWSERLPIYQLYHLLNHLNLFGEAYGGQVDAILRRYVG